MKKMSYVSAVDFALSILSQMDPTQIALHDDDLGTSHDVSVGEICEKLTGLRESLAKRASRKPTGPSKAQIARAELAERLFGAMEAGVEYSSADLAGLLPELKGATPQKITALVKALGERVSATKVKGKAVYSIA